MTDKPSQTAHNFWSTFVADMTAIATRVSPFFASAGAVVNGLIQITRRGESFDAASESYLQISAYPPIAGDPIAVIPMADGNNIILGKIQTATELSPISSVEIYGEGQGLTGANVSSNTSTSLYVDAVNTPIVVGLAGTYKYIGKATGVFKHSVAAGAVSIRFRAVGSNTVTGVAKVPKVHDTALAEMAIGQGDSLPGITVAAGGTITVTWEYACSTAGTVNARNAAVGGILIRTGP